MPSRAGARTAAGAGVSWRASRLFPQVTRLLRIGMEGQHSAWLAPVLLWLASRVFSTALLVTAYAVATMRGWPFDASRDESSFAVFSGWWDAWFYRGIATSGYPPTLPTDAAGHVAPNAWAFLPVFPMLVHVVMATGASFWIAGLVVATLAGLGATVLLYRLVCATGGPGRARRGTALFVFGPTGFLLQVSYAESLFLLLLFAALLALVHERYVLVTVLGVVAAFTRPGVLALALAVAVHLVVRHVRACRGGPPFPWPARLAAVGAGLLLAAAGLAWPVVAAVVTGRPDAYLATEVSWWVGFVGRREFVPLTPWFVMAARWLGPAGVVLVVAMFAAAAVFLTRRSVRAVGADVLAFVVSYGLYLVAVFLPQQSLPRLLMPMAPLLGSDAFVRTRRRTLAWLVVGASLQPVAIVFLWLLGYP